MGYVMCVFKLQEPMQEIEFVLQYSRWRQCS